jgi:hypothetical protein
VCAHAFNIADDKYEGAVGFELVPVESNRRVPIPKDSIVMTFNAEPGDVASALVLSGKLRDKLIEDGMITAAASGITNACINALNRMFGSRLLDEDTASSESTRQLRTVTHDIVTLYVVMDQQSPGVLYVELPLNRGATYVTSSYTHGGESSGGIGSSTFAWCYTSCETSDCKGECTFSVLLTGGTIWFDPVFYQTGSTGFFSFTTPDGPDEWGWSGFYWWRDGNDNYIVANKGNGQIFFNVEPPTVEPTTYTITPL